MHNGFCSPEKRACRAVAGIVQCCRIAKCPTANALPALLLQIPFEEQFASFSSSSLCFHCSLHSCKSKRLISVLGASCSDSEHVPCFPPIFASLCLTRTHFKACVFFFSGDVGVSVPRILRSFAWRRCSVHVLGFQARSLTLHDRRSRRCRASSRPLANASNSGSLLQRAPAGMRDEMRERVACSTAMRHVRGWTCSRASVRACGSFEQRVIGDPKSGLTPPPEPRPKWLSSLLALACARPLTRPGPATSAIMSSLCRPCPVRRSPST